MTHIKGFKVRIFPTNEQKILISKHFGACRFIWNYFLNLEISKRNNNENYLFPFEMMKLLKPLKQTEYPWLYEVSNGSLQVTITQLWNAYNRFFKGLAKYPKFKKKKTGLQSYPVCSAKTYFLDEVVHVPKIGKVKYKTDLKIPLGNKIHFVRVVIKKECNEKYFLCFNYECENQALCLTDKIMGIDLGIKETAVVAFDDEKFVYHNINKSKQIKELESKIKYHQKSLSRKYETNHKISKTYESTKNIEKEKQKIRLLNKKIRDIRSNYIHQITNELINKKPKRIVMETLNVNSLVKNKYLAKRILEQSFYEFIRVMKYKCQWNGIQFVQAPLYFPSSKTCSNCGHIRKNLSIFERTFVCPECNFTIDRDYNAAINLMRYKG